MSATRLLILGVLKKRQPLHGYDIRQELELWGAEEWANIAYGSIYFALGKMAEEGLIEAVGTEQVGKRPARTAYALAERGEREFGRLLRAYWWERKRVVDPFQVALTFVDELPRDELLAALRARVNGLRAALEAFAHAGDLKLGTPGTPRHIAENLRLAAAHTETELRWAEEAIGKVERGELP